MEWQAVYFCSIGTLLQAYKAILTAETMSTEETTIFLTHWASNVPIPTKLLTDNNRQVTRKVFATICTKLGLKAMVTIEYHPFSEGHIETFNETIACRSWEYFAKHQERWDTFKHILTYGYDGKAHWIINGLPFSLVLFWKSLRPATVWLLIKCSIDISPVELLQRLRLI